MTHVHPIRLADKTDLPLIEALLAPELARGTVLPRQVSPGNFLVGEAACASLTPWSTAVVELGSVVSHRPGMGSLVVEAACAEANARGFSEVVVLTSLVEWFAQRGFVATDMQELRTAHCASCPMREGCTQVLMVRHVG